MFVLCCRHIYRHAANRIDCLLVALGAFQQSLMIVVVRMFHFINPTRVYYRLDEYTPYRYLSIMHEETKISVRKRLNRIEGQIRGLSKMVEEDRYCIDIVTQISAVRAALRRAEEEVLRDHVGHCVEHAISSGDRGDQRQKVAEMMELLGRVDR